MSPHKIYTVSIGGLPHTMRLSEDHARRLGAVEVQPAPEAKQVKAPKNKQRGSVSNKAKPSDSEE